MAPGEGDTGERAISCETHIHPNPVSSVFHLVAQDGNFRAEQKEDNHLKHCWGQMQQLERLSQNPEQWLPAAYFLLKRGQEHFQTDCPVAAL